MTYDQAQNYRLGQAAPFETTSIRIFTGTQIPEAAWRGQMIYREDTQEIQVFDGEAWRDVVGGTEGQRTFVGDDDPAALARDGDIWYDTSVAGMNIPRYRLDDEWLDLGDARIPPLNAQMGVVEDRVGVVEGDVDDLDGTINGEGGLVDTVDELGNTVSLLDQKYDDLSTDYYDYSQGTTTVLDNVQTTLDRKNTVTYATEPPTSAPNGDIDPTVPGVQVRTIGDTWIDTDDGNKQYRWGVPSGESEARWVVVKPDLRALDESIDSLIDQANNTAQSALSAAQAAVAIADNNIRTYYTDDPPLYSDLRLVNWIPEPVPLSTSTTWDRQLGTGGAATTSVAGTSPRYYQMAWTTKPTGGQAGIIVPRSPIGAISGGQNLTLMLKISMGNAVSRSMSAYIDWYSGDSLLWGEWIWSDTVNSTWKSMKIALSVPSDVGIDGFRVRVNYPSASGVFVGDLLRVTQACAVALPDDTTIEGAEIWDGNYFDGSTADTDDYFFHWLTPDGYPVGTPGYTGVAGAGLSAAYPAAILGDMWYDTSPGVALAYRWLPAGWVLIEDDYIASALSRISEVEVGLDRKTTSYYLPNAGWRTTDADGNPLLDAEGNTISVAIPPPVPPLSSGETAFMPGDLWFDTLDYNRQYLFVDVTPETGTAGWVMAQDYWLSLSLANSTQASGTATQTQVDTLLDLIVLLDSKIDAYYPWVESLDQFKQPLDDTLTGLSADDLDEGQMVYASGYNDFTPLPTEPFGRSLLNLTDALSAAERIGVWTKPSVGDITTFDPIGLFNSVVVAGTKMV